MKKQIISGLLTVAMVASMSAMATVSVTAEAKDNSEITIGFSSKDNSDMFVKNIADAAQAKADELCCKLIMADASGDTNKQISDVENFIAM